MPKGLVISDLHLFSSRSSAQVDFESYRSRLSQYDICILNGDIFDFRWTTLPSIAQTVEHAFAFCTKLLEENRSCEFHYVLGNHDSLRGFVERLPELEEKFTNFIWYPHYVKLGNHLFLHGDIIHVRSPQAGSLESYRSNFEHADILPKNRHMLYAGLVKTRLHTLAYFLNPPRRSCQRVLEYFETHEQEILDGVRHIFFGHTHSPFSALEHDGFIFHNTGSMIRGMKHNFVEFELAS
ncbi:MAG: metallophosphoesterase [Bdellovibrionales bacterium]|nr:metallophosphoesterase [Bdellovibrionales bacterium]